MLAQLENEKKLGISEGIINFEEFSLMYMYLEFDQNTDKDDNDVHPSRRSITSRESKKIDEKREPLVPKDEAIIYEESEEDSEESDDIDKFQADTGRMKMTEYEKNKPKARPSKFTTAI